MIGDNVVMFFLEREGMAQAHEDAVGDCCEAAGRAENQMGRRR